MKKKENSNKGITLIALVITIIILLILSGITIIQLTGSGLFGKANWSSFITEFYNVEEATRLYNMNYEIQKYENNGIKQKHSTDENAWPIKEDSKIENNSLEESLKETIENIENTTITEENTEIYQIDLSLIDRENVKNKYLINIKSGKIYLLDAYRYNNTNYYRPEYGTTGGSANTIRITIDKPQYATDYKFFSNNKSEEIEIKFKVNIPEEIAGAQVKVTESTTALGIMKQGTYDSSTGIYTTKVQGNGSDNPNGIYVYQVKVTSDGKEYQGTTSVTLNRYLDDPILEVEDVKETEIKVKVINDYPEEVESEIKYIYYKDNEAQTEKIGDKMYTVQNLESKGTYMLKVIAYINDTENAISSEIQQKTLYNPYENALIPNLNDTNENEELQAGQCYADHYYSNCKGNKAFDGNDNTYWYLDDTCGYTEFPNLYYNFGENVDIYKIYAYLESPTINKCDNKFSVYVSNDNVNYTKIYETEWTWEAVNEKKVIDEVLEQPVKCRYVKICAGTSVEKYLPNVLSPKCYKIQFYGKN